MKEFNQLLEYRNYYEYSFDCEAVRVLDGEFHDEATKLYSHFIKDYFMKDTDKWAFDIALDCIKNFTDEECNIIKEQEEIFDYHLGYGMYVRNRYVHSSKFHSYLMAESVSGRVAGYIYTILLPIYNCLSEEYMKLIGDYDFDDIKKQYGDRQPIIKEMEEKLAKWEQGLTAKSAMQTIRSTIRESLGPDGFKNIIFPIAEEHITKHKHINIEWREFIDKLYSNTKVYYKEYNRFKAIQELNVISRSSGLFPIIKSVDEARDYIMDNLGFSYDDSLYMAECALAIGKMQDKVNNV